MFTSLRGDSILFTCMYIPSHRSTCTTPVPLIPCLDTVDLIQFFLCKKKKNFKKKKVTLEGKRSSKRIITVPFFFAPKTSLSPLQK